MAGMIDKIKHAWNAFNESEKQEETYSNGGSSYGGTSYRGNRSYTPIYNRKKIVSSVYNRITVDVAALPIRHVRLDNDDNYKEEIKSYLNDCLKVNANEDQTGRDMIQEVVWTMFDEGTAAIIPIETTLNPAQKEGYDITDIRVGTVTEMLPEANGFPSRVRVRAFNKFTGQREEMIMPKHLVAIVYNPFYAIMNEPNSTLQRLIEKLRLLDKVDEASASGKLDLIFQLPYVIKTKSKREQADERARDIDFQLRTNEHGIAYVDGTEKITQLNRPAESNLWTQVEKLTELLYDELGLTTEILKGTADEAAMLNYHNRTVEPIVSAIVDAMVWKFLSKTARTQGQSIMAFRDPFRLVPMEKMAEIADKFTRNEILSSNEIRSKLGIKPSTDPKANELRNSNMPEPKPEQSPESTIQKEEGDNQNGT